MNRASLKIAVIELAKAYKSKGTGNLAKVRAREDMLLAVVRDGEREVVSIPKQPRKQREKEVVTPEAISEEEKEFDKQEDLSGPEPKNNKSELDRQWILEQVKNAPESSWSDEGLVVRAGTNRDFGDNLLGFLQKNGVGISTLELSPGVAMQEGSPIQYWNIILKR